MSKAEVVVRKVDFQHISTVSLVDCCQPEICLSHHVPSCRNELADISMQEFPYMQSNLLCHCIAGPSDGSVTSISGRHEDTDGIGGAASPLLDIFEPRPVLSGGLEAVLGQEAQSLGSMPGQ